MSIIRKNINLWQEFSQIEQQDAESQSKINPQAHKQEPLNEDSLSVLVWQNQDTSE